MFEKFTDRSKKVFNLAEQEAKRLNHEYLGTEHVLLGLIKEGSGVGATVLKNYDLNLEKLRTELEKLVRPGSETITMGKLPYTPRAKKLVENAIEYARSLSHDYVGTEHILYGVVADTECISSQILQNFELNTEKIQKGIEDLLGIGNEKSSEINKNNSDYWMIPRDKLELQYFLKSQFVLEESIREHLCFDIRSKGCQVGKLNKSEMGYDLVTVLYEYHPNTQEQINLALKFKEILDLNNIQYEESPPRKELAKKLRESVSGTTSLADRLEKD